MSHFDIRADRTQRDDIRPVVPLPLDEDVPARRLLAHDLEPLVWDDDGDEAVPPPD